MKERPLSRQAPPEAESTAEVRSGASPARASSRLKASRSSFEMRTQPRVSPSWLRRTMTLRCRCRSMPTYYVDNIGLSIRCWLFLAEASVTALGPARRGEARCSFEARAITAPGWVGAARRLRIGRGDSRENWTTTGGSPHYEKTCPYCEARESRPGNSVGPTTR